MTDTRELQYLEDYFRNHPTNEALRPIAEFFLSFQKGNGNLESLFGELLRQSLDEVIDMHRTRRFSIDELEKTEKTYIGTKVEIIARNTFNLAKGELLDLLIDGIEVDVKNTVGRNWMIPRSAALDELVSSIPYTPGDRIIARDEEGDPVYEDIGHTPVYLRLIDKHINSLRKGGD